MPLLLRNPDVCLFSHPHPLRSRANSATIPPAIQTRDILSTLSFYQLTNCSAQCTYQDTNFGSFPDPNPGDSVKRYG